MTPDGVGPITAEARYRPVLASQGRSETLRTIWRDAYGADYPAEVEPLGFITTPDLVRMGRWLGVGAGDTFVDLGCGRGGPGLWLARETGACVVGVDIAEEAVAAAAGRMAQFGMAGRARYQTGSFTATGLPDGQFHAALSVDSLWMVLDKPAAVREVARITCPGARWVLTTWQPRYLWYRTLLEDAGFEVLVHEEPAGWRERQRAVYAGIVRERDRLTDELGQAAAEVLVAEAHEIAPVLDDYQRLIIVACR